MASKNLSVIIMSNCSNNIWSVKPTARECFSREVVLGRLEDPLIPSPHCQPRDISEDGSGSGFACLCTTNLCNNLNSTNSLEENRDTQQQLKSSKKLEKNTKQTSTPRKDLKSGNYSCRTWQVVKIPHLFLSSRTSTICSSS